MESTVLFRDFEERDINFVFKCKNDQKLNANIIGNFKPFTYTDAEKWVHGCMGTHESFRFWAVCTNDEEKRIIGWISLSNIDKNNKSAHFHGIVIGDKEYQDGFAWIESYLFILEYTFQKLFLNRLTGSHLESHPMSGAIASALFFKVEGIFRQAFFKNGAFIDEIFVAILQEEYNYHKERGDYDIYKVVTSIINYKKNRYVNK